jgi:hypothetical protein
MHRIALFFVLALAACGGGMQRPGVDLEPESLILEVDADTPIRIACVRGYPCEADAYGEATATIEADGTITIGDLAIPARVSVETSASVERTDASTAGPSSVRVCLSSPMLGPLCFDSAR